MQNAAKWEHVVVADTSIQALEHHDADLDPLSSMVWVPVILTTPFPEILATPDRL